MPACHKLIRIAVVISAVASLAGCRDLPGIYFQIQHSESVPTTSCEQLAGILSERLSFQVAYVHRSQVPGDSIVCTAQLGNSGERPKMSVGVVLFHDRRMVIDVEEYRWGSTTLP